MDVDYVQLYFDTLDAAHEPDWVALYRDMTRVYKETGNKDALWMVFQIYANHEEEEVNPFTLEFDWSLLKNMALQKHTPSVNLYLQLCLDNYFKMDTDAVVTIVRDNYLRLEPYTFNVLLTIISQKIYNIVRAHRDMRNVNPNGDFSALQTECESLHRCGITIGKLCIDRNFEEYTVVSPRDVYYRLSGIALRKTVLGVYFMYKSGKIENITNDLCGILMMSDLMAIDSSLHEWIHKPGRYGEFPIQVAAMFGRFHAVKALIALGASLDVYLPHDPKPLYMYALLEPRPFLANYLAPADCTHKRVLMERAHVRRCCDATRALMLVCRRQRWMDRFMVERIGRLVYATRYTCIWDFKLQK